MKTLKIHKDNIDTKSFWNFYKWYHIDKMSDVGYGIYDCEVNDNEMKWVQKARYQNT